MYSQGNGVRQDYLKAAEYYRKSAINGNTEAQTNLGYLYYRGEGVEYNVDIAKDWLGKACDNGNQNACGSYSRINQYGRL